MAGKRGHGNFLTAEERELLQRGIAAGETRAVLARRFNLSVRTVNLYQALHRAAGDVKHFHVPKLCFAEGCDAAPVRGLKFCQRHRYRLPAGAALSRLMAGK